MATQPSESKAFAYLQVRNGAGELLGLMRGPFPIEWIRRGVISFVERRPFCVDVHRPERIEPRRFDVPVQWWAQPQWWVRPAVNGPVELWPCLVWRDSLEDLQKLKGFR